MSKIHELLLNNIYSFTSSEESNQIKVFSKSLHVILWLIKDKENSMKELFLENISLFVEIRNYFIISNKKIYDIVKQILYHLNFEDNDNKKSDYNFNETNNENYDNENNDNKDSDIKVEQCDVDLFNLTTDNSNLTQKSNTKMNNQSTNNNDNKKNFKFIKKKNNESTNNNEVSNNIQTKQVISDIDEIFTSNNNNNLNNNLDLIGIENQSKELVTNDTKSDSNILIDMCSLGNTDLNDIFTNEKKNVKTAQLNDLINKLNDNINLNNDFVNQNHNIINTNNSNNGNDLKLITSNSNQFNMKSNDVNLYYQIPTINTNTNTNTNKIKLCTSDENFNYAKIYGEENKPKDHFEFVKQMMNTKK